MDFMKVKQLCERRAPRSEYPVCSLTQGGLDEKRRMAETLIAKIIIGKCEIDITFSRFSLKLPRDGGQRGKWLVGEQMPIELSPAAKLKDAIILFRNQLAEESVHPRF